MSRRTIRSSLSRARGAALLFGAALAASTLLACSSPSHPPQSLVEWDTGTADARDAAPDTLVDATPEAASETGADASETGTPADAGAADTGGTDTGTGDDGWVAPVAPTCALPSKLGAGTALSTLSTTDDELLGGITPDERTIAWVATDAAGVSRLRFADRARPDDPFGSWTALEVPEGPLARGRIALSPDGLRLVFVTADGRGLRQLSRAARGEAFVPQADGAPFAAIAQMVADAPADRVSDPVLGFDDRTLYFVFQESMASHIRRATRGAAGSEATWTRGDPLLESDLRPDGALGARPTAVSADALVLFVWGETTGRAYAAMRDDASSPYAKLVDLGPRRALAASADCSRVYYSAPGPTDDLDLWTATAP
jgi:hypothetical protein